MIPQRTIFSVGKDTPLQWLTPGWNVGYHDTCTFIAGCQLLKPSARLLYRSDHQNSSKVKTMTRYSVPEALGHVAIGALPCQLGLDNENITLSSTCERLETTPQVGH